MVDEQTQALIERWIVPERGRANARLAESGVSVWILAGYFANADGNIEQAIDQVIDDYELPREAVEAALAYYHQDKYLIDARRALNEDTFIP